MTIGDLRDLHDEDWSSLGLTVFASRALKNALQGKLYRSNSTPRNLSRSGSVSVHGGSGNTNTGNTGVIGIGLPATVSQPASAASSVPPSAQQSPVVAQGMYQQIPQQQQQYNSQQYQQ